MIVYHPHFKNKVGMENGLGVAIPIVCNPLNSGIHRLYQWSTSSVVYLSVTGHLSQECVVCFRSPGGVVPFQSCAVMFVVLASSLMALMVHEPVPLLQPS